mgnify:CR=1 FL=1
MTPAAIRAWLKRNGWVWDGTTRNESTGWTETTWGRDSRQEVTGEGANMQEALEDVYRQVQPLDAALPGMGKRREEQP